MRCLATVAAAWIVVAGANARAISAQTPTRVGAADSMAWNRIAAAENARAATAEQLQDILNGTHSRSATIRAVSVRALGRLERPELTDSIAQFLRDPSTEVRARAAIAIALANIANRTPAHAREIIENALTGERSPLVIGALAEAFGRLRNANVEGARAASAVLLQYITKEEPARLGVVRGLHFIARQGAAMRPGLDTARSALVRIATAQGSASSIHSRRLATETLALAGFGDDAIVTRIMRDPDPVVRREAMLMAALPLRDTAVARRIAMQGLRDAHWIVRYEALRQLGSRVGPRTPCSVIEPYARDTGINTHVQLQAIDLLGARCIATPATVTLLDSIATALPAAGAKWHAAAHALTSLAARDANRARTLTQQYAGHTNLFVRTYAAQTASITRDTAKLRRLAFDAHPNVRTAAVEGLSRLIGHAGDSIYLAQLALDDGQLLLTAAAALDSSRTPDAAARVLDALDRVTALRTENSRDGRVALINIIPRIGNASHAARITPYLEDFDPAVAERAAAILKGWGSSAVAAAKPLPPEPMPSFAELAGLSNARVAVEMANGLVLEVRLLPFDAPTNAARFARLARDGWFDGLTLHRVEPSFVVQGGSPNANEYAGAPRFSRDEVGYPNNRGTIGLSTRGHDTGDAQIFINIIDNAWLDPLYTVFAEVTNGVTVIDRILEGAVIRRITIR